MINEKNRKREIDQNKPNVNGLTIAILSSDVCAKRKQTVTASVPIMAKKREIQVLRLVTVLHWDGLRPPVVDSAMMDENYGGEHSQ
jgi:hypothetical protein